MEKYVKIVVMLGGNIGDIAQTFRFALDELASGGVSAPVMGSIRRSAAVDCVPGTPDFCDAAVSGFWQGGADELLRLCQEIERRAGRPACHSSRESRTLDIDVILFGSEPIRLPGLIVPHPRAAVRRFVLEAVCDVAPEMVFPGLGLTAPQLLDKLR